MHSSHYLSRLLSVLIGLAGVVLLGSVVQQVLTDRSVALGEAGQVAGVSIERVVKGQGAACQQKNQEDSAALEQYQQQVETDSASQEQQALQPYEQARSELSGTAQHIQQESAALDEIEQPVRDDYRQKLEAVEGAVESQKKEIGSRLCSE